MGTWGHGPFENDAAIDILAALEATNSKSALKEALMKYSTDSAPLSAEEGQEAVALVALLVYLLGGRPSQWFDVLENYRFDLEADTSDIAVASRLLDSVSSDLSPLHEAWKGGDQAHWLASVASLGYALDDLSTTPKRRPERRRSQPAPGYAQGDAIAIVLSDGSTGYVQFVGECGGSHLWRVLHGRYIKPLGQTELRKMALMPAVHRSLGDPAEILKSGTAKRVGNFPIPQSEADCPPLRSYIVPSERNPLGWEVEFPNGDLITGRDFSDRHPEVDQSKLPDVMIPLSLRQVVEEATSAEG